jgi:thiosulfate/3-mercaptopyruvate sulfurtransferase
VAYDDAGGSLAAGRLWWMLRWLGHDCAAVLDGGWSKWIEEGRPVRSGRESRITRDFIPLPHAEKIVSADQVEIMRLDPEYRVIDVRAPERYRGELEPIDPVAGHIPGAVSVPYTGNMTLEGTFLPPEELRELYDGILGEVPAEKVAFYCGSGVTSVHGILAMLHAGYREPKLYVGSWSEWITDPERPVDVE